MGKFSNYIDNINQQTELLRENLSKAINEDCSKKSIGGCASALSRFSLTDYQDSDIYKRPDWYPDIEDILNRAPVIIIGNYHYYPSYACIVKAIEDVTPFYRASAKEAGYRICGNRAVLCSDTCDNDIANANENTLIVGDSIQHQWDTSKDITSQGADHSIRWYVIYNRGSLAAPTDFVSISDYQDVTKIECAFGAYVDGYRSTGSSTSYACPSLKYIVYTEAFNNTRTASYRNQVLSGLNTLIIKSPQYFTSQSIQASRLVYLSIQAGKDITLSGLSGFKYLEITSDPLILRYPDVRELSVCNLPDSIEEIYNLTYLNYCDKVKLPANLQKLYSSAMYADKLLYLELPPSLNEWTGTSSSLSSTLDSVEYIKLFEDFNISGLVLSGRRYKSVQWLKDLCSWLKDRTGEVANTMKIGSTNLTNAREIYLTFNPNDKRDITWVDAGTEGAINIVQFITEQLNWTLS